MGRLLEPIVILAMPRSGSSMTGGIFHLHGCWEGNCRRGDRINPKGYHENLDVKAILIRKFGRLAQGIIPATSQDGFRNEVMKLKPKGRWFVKHSAMYREAWHEFSPRFVCVRRKTEGLIGSNTETGFMGTRNPDKLKAIIDAHNEQMDLSGGVDVFTDDLVKGDYSSISRALEYCGIEPDFGKIEEFVEPSLWERWQSATA